MSEPSPELRSLYSRLGALESWSRTEDRTARTAPGRAAMLAKFEREVDPDGRLAPAERARRAEYKRKAHYTRLAIKSAQARAAKAKPPEPKPTPEQRAQALAQRAAELDRLAAGDAS